MHVYSSRVGKWCAHTHGEPCACTTYCTNPPLAPLGNSDVAVAATLRSDSSHRSGVSLKEMSKPAMVFRGSQNLAPLTCSLLLPPQAAEENVVPVSVLMAAAHVTAVPGTHLAAGTWRVNMSSATVACPLPPGVLSPHGSVSPALSLVAVSHVAQQV